MEEIIQFNKLNEENKESFGSKAYNLSLIKKYTNVPAGFVISKNVMNEFFEHNNLLEVINRYLSSLMINNENIIPVVNAIQKAIIISNFDNHPKENILELYAGLSFSNTDSANVLLKENKDDILICVRNGSWSENSDNIYQMNIIGKNRLIESIKIIFASNFTSKKVIDRKEKNIDLFEEAISSVIVQKMELVQRSGIATSFNPNNKSEKEIMIRANFGLGIAKDDENLGFDEYIIDKDYELIKSKIGNQAYAYEKDIDSYNTVKYDLKENSEKEKINQDHMKTIGQTIKKLSRILNSPLIIEWGFNKNKLVIFDAKPLLEDFDEDVEKTGSLETENVIEETENTNNDLVIDKQLVSETNNEDYPVIENIEIPEEITTEETDSPETYVTEEENSSKTENVIEEENSSKTENVIEEENSSKTENVIEIYEHDKKNSLETEVISIDDYSTQDSPIIIETETIDTDTPNYEKDLEVLREIEKEKDEGFTNLPYEQSSKFSQAQTYEEADKFNESSEIQEINSHGEKISSELKNKNSDASKINVVKDEAFNLEEELEKDVVEEINTEKINFSETENVDKKDEDLSMDDFDDNLLTLDDLEEEKIEEENGKDIDSFNEPKEKIEEDTEDSDFAYNFLDEDDKTNSHGKKISNEQKLKTSDASKTENVVIEGEGKTSNDFFIPENIPVKEEPNFFNKETDDSESNFLKNIEKSDDSNEPSFFDNVEETEDVIENEDNFDDDSEIKNIEAHEVKLQDTEVQEESNSSKTDVVIEESEKIEPTDESNFFSNIEVEEDGDFIFSDRDEDKK